MKKIKVLYISHSSGISGAEHCLLTLITKLRKNSFNPVVIFPSHGPLKEKIQDLGVKTYISRFDWWIKSQNHVGTMDDKLRSRVEDIANIIDLEKPDVIHTNTSVIWEGAIAAAIRRIPHIWHLHEKLEEHPTLKSYLPLPLVYRIIDFLSYKVIMASDAVRNNFSDIIPSNKLKTIYNGIDVKKFQSAESCSLRHELGLADDTQIVLSIGTIQKEKGYDTLLQVASLTIKANKKIKFIIAGAGTLEAVDDLRQKVKKLHLRDSVYYLGFRDDIHEILKGSDLLVISSLTEAFPLAALEAMAAGKPVIATDCGGLREMIVDGETGFILPVNDSEGLCRKILEIATDNDKRLDIGEKAFKRVSLHFNADDYANNFECLYKEVVSSTAGRQISGGETLVMELFFQLYHEMAENRRQVVQKEMQIQALKNTWSWFLTIPLRNAAHLLGKIKRIYKESHGAS